MPDKSAYGRTPAPSVWVNWKPQRNDVDCFYNSVVVNESSDNTFFMTNGWGAGYLGLQDRKPKLVLFSVWDLPGCNASLVTKGKETKTDKFGGEGTGCKSWIEFDWQIGVRYSCCVTAKPGQGGATVYSGYFMHPDQGWILIASFATKHPDHGHSLQGLGAFTEDWMSGGNGGKTCRKSCLGPALVHFAGSGGTDWYSCEDCWGTSQDTRQTPGYLNRSVQCLPGSLSIEVCSGGLQDLNPNLFRGSLQTHIVPCPSIILVGGPFAGVYCAGGHFINGQLYYHCIKKGIFIAFSASGDWHLADMKYLNEIIHNQGSFGSLDHSSNKTHRIIDSKWQNYQMKAMRFG